LRQVRLPKIVSAAAASPARHSGRSPRSDGRSGPVTRPRERTRWVRSAERLAATGGRRSSATRSVASARRPSITEPTPKAHLAANEADIAHGRWQDTAGVRLTFNELAKRWLASDPSKRATTLARDRTIVRTSLASHALEPP
ncbi:MAG: hypothetical protein ACRD1T_01290, partial [Acidimicrobiia bacterium]